MQDDHRGLPGRLAQQPGQTQAGLGFVPISLMKEIKSQAPDITCEIASWKTSRTAIVNRAIPPFDNPELPRAIMLTLDRKAFIDIIGEG